MGKREEKRRKMAEVIHRWRASGLSARAFSKDSGIPEAQFWYWKRRVDGEVATPSFVPLRILEDERSAVSACFELTLGDGRRLVIPPALTGRPLRQLLLALRSC